MLMQYVETITTDADGAATVYLGSVIRGRIVAIKYAPGTIATGADLTITGETSGIAILTKANAGTSTVWFNPLAIPHKVADGSAFTDFGVDIWLYRERVKVVVAEGGNTFTGTISLWVDEEQ